MKKISTLAFTFMFVLSVMLLVSGCATTTSTEANNRTTEVTEANVEVTETKTEVTETMTETPEEYALRVKEFKARLINVAVKGEDMLNLVRSTWNNTIYERLDPRTDAYTLRSRNPNKFHSDFNTSLGKLFESGSYSAKARFVEEERPKLARELRSFRDHPEGCEHIYSALVEYHDICDSIIELGANPSGSLKSYSEKIDNVYDRFDKVANDLDVELSLVLDP